MPLQSLLVEADRVDEPRTTQEYSNLLSQVAAEGKPIIVRRHGEDLAAVIPLEHLELLREVAAREEVEKLATQIEWDHLPKMHRPPPEWFDDNDDPFERE